ncbi:hypothetical protein EP331_00185 [bacterium]|nr:MAG: hypothetical protein EP331_00185 [bacterium]
MSSYIGQITIQGFTDPNANYLKCDGAAISRTTYADLFAVISTTYGVGDGSTTFNLPDLQGRVPLGAGSGSGLTSRTLGATGGQEVQTEVILSGGSMDTTNGGSSSIDVMNPFVVVQAVICYQVATPTGDYRYLEELSADASIADTDILYAVKTPTTTPQSVYQAWSTIKTWLKNLFNSYEVISLGTNPTTANANSARELDITTSAYTANTTTTFSNGSNLRRFAWQLTNTNANVLTIAGITVYFKSDDLPSGVTFASNALTFPADSAVKYNIVGEKFDGSTFDCKIEIR